jgi:hypothetical protein
MYSILLAFSLMILFVESLARRYLRFRRLSGCLGVVVDVGNASEAAR